MWFAANNQSGHYNIARMASYLDLYVWLFKGYMRLGSRVKRTILLLQGS